MTLKDSLKRLFGTSKKVAEIKSAEFKEKAADTLDKLDDKADEIADKLEEKASAVVDKLEVKLRSTIEKPAEEPADKPAEEPADSEEAAATEPDPVKP